MAVRCIECGKRKRWFSDNLAGVDLQAHAQHPYPERTEQVILPGQRYVDFLCRKCANKRTVVCIEHGPVAATLREGHIPICPSCAQEELSDVDRPQDLEVLCRKGLVRVEANGESITSIYAQIRSLADYRLCVFVPPGTYFVARGSHQNMVVTCGRDFVLKPGKSMRMPVRAACINASLPIPDSDGHFCGVRKVPDDVAAFLIASRNEQDMTIQAGVWALTDNYSGHQVQNRLVMRDRRGNTRQAVSDSNIERAANILDWLSLPHRLAEGRSFSRESPDPNLQAEIGARYLSGEEIQQDTEKALQWFRKAAKHGSVDAMYALGKMFHDGFAVKGNPKTAAKWYRTAASNGQPDAMYKLAYMYVTGAGVRRNVRKAVELFSQSSQNGIVTALNDEAWFRATEESVYDPHRALRLAERCLEELPDDSPQEMAAVLDTLACACAEVGDFARAVQTLRRAIGLLDDSDAGYAEIEAHLRLFEKGITYTESLRAR